MCICQFPLYHALRDAYCFGLGFKLYLYLTNFIRLKMLARILFFVGLFKQTLQFLQQYNVKNVHQVSGAGIQTYDLMNASLLP